MNSVTTIILRRVLFHTAHRQYAMSRVHTKKRKDYISWDEYFMGLACLSAMRSKGRKWSMCVICRSQYTGGRLVDFTRAFHA